MLWRMIAEFTSVASSHGPSAILPNDGAALLKCRFEKMQSDTPDGGKKIDFCHRVRALRDRGPCAHRPMHLIPASGRDLGAPPGGGQGRGPDQRPLARRQDRPPTLGQCMATRVRGPPARLSLLSAALGAP